MTHRLTEFAPYGYTLKLGIISGYNDRRKNKNHSQPRIDFLSAQLLHSTDIVRIQ